MNFLTALWAVFSPASFTGAICLLLAFSIYKVWPWTGPLAVIFLAGLFLFFRSRRLFWVFAAIVGLIGIGQPLFDFNYLFLGQ